MNSLGQGWSCVSIPIIVRLQVQILHVPQGTASVMDVQAAVDPNFLVGIVSSFGDQGSPVAKDFAKAGHIRWCANAKIPGIKSLETCYFIGCNKYMYYPCAVFIQIHIELLFRN